MVFFLVLNLPHKTWQSAPLPTDHLDGPQIEAILDNTLVIFFSSPCPFSFCSSNTGPYTYKNIVPLYSLSPYLIVYVI